MSIKLSNEQVLELARQYGQQCIANGQIASQSGFSRFCGMGSDWFHSTSPLRRAIVLKEWMTMKVRMNPSGGGKPIKDPPTPMPDKYPVGDDLYGILNHPGRLAMFCSLAKSGGIEGALVYAQQQHERFYAEPEAAEDAA